MDRLELKVPPPLVALVVGFLMWLTSLVVPSFDVPFRIRLGAALALAFIGLGVSLAGVISFRRARTTVNPTKPTSASSLVTTGVFRFTRNPMYVSLALELLAWGIFLSNLMACLWLPLFVLYITRFQISPEERALLSIFGKQYAEYKETVGRWL